MEFDFLIPSFLEAMNDIGRYGHEKYGVDSFQFRRLAGDTSRNDMDRNRTPVIAKHAIGHFEEYLKGNLHDKFNDEVHQLAAVAFNAMMEAYYAGLAR